MSSQPVRRPIPPPPPGYESKPVQPQHQSKPRPRRKSRAGQAIAILIVLLLLFMILFYSPFGPILLGPLMGQNTYPASSTFTLTNTLEIDIRHGEVSYAFDLPVPQDYVTSYGMAQDVSSVSTSPTASQISKYGKNWVQWTGTDDDFVQVSITTQATVQTIIWDIDASNSGMASSIPASMDYQLGNEWEILDEDDNPTGQYKIWPSNPTIQSLANTLTSDSATVYENVKRIYDYVRQNVEYQTLAGSDPKACLETLADGTGDCDDQSILLISLCRSVDIPAWLAFGTLYDQIRAEWGPHAWAEIYVPLASGGAEEVVIDPANGEFFVRNCNRLEEWKSDGNGAHLDDYYHPLLYNYTLVGTQPVPVVIFADSLSGGYSSTGSITGYILLDTPRKNTATQSITPGSL